MKKLLLTLAAMIAVLPMMAERVERPRLVVGIIVDQMRWDFLYTNYERYGNGGFLRLLNDGLSYGNCMVDFLPTITACGHASLYTGTTPAIHGIAGNSWWENGERFSACGDDSVEGVGTTNKVGKKSPRNMQVTTLGDEMKLATDFRSKVIALGLKDRAAILPGGHAANGAFWFDGELPGYITSSYYMKDLPKWVKDYNKKHKKDLAKDHWNTIMGVRTTMELAREAVDGEKLGNDNVPDLLAISLSTTDAVQHNFGTRSTRTDSIYLEIDRQLEQLLKHLDSRVGKGNYLVFLTSDHGGTHNYKYMTSNKLPSGAWSPWGDKPKLDAYLQGVFGVDKLILAEAEYYFYLDNAKIAQNKLDREAVKAEAVKWLMSQPDVQWAVDVEHIDRVTMPAEIKERIVKGYHPQRSGEIYVLPVTGYFAGDRTAKGSNHGSWNQGDSHIPLIFMGWHIKPGENNTRCNMSDIVPTVCSMLHIQSPDGALGNPLF